MNYLPWLPLVFALGASTDEMMMQPEDIVHMSWLNGPAYSDKMAGRAQWPSLPVDDSVDSGHSLILLGSGGQCVKESNDILITSGCSNGANGLALRHQDGGIGSIVDDSGNTVCPSEDGSSLHMAGPDLCDSDTKFHVNSDGVFVHTASGQCLMGDTGTSARGDTNTLSLGSDCTNYVFEFWTEWNYPPGYEQGWEIGGSASGSQGARWSFLLSNCEAYWTTSFVDASGAVASMLTATRTSDGAEFPYLISSINHQAWNCRFYFYMAPDESGVYPTVEEWNAFFLTGDVMTFSEKEASEVCDTALGACNPCADDYSGFASSFGSYCKTSSSRMDLEKHLLLWSGRLGLLVDVDGPHFIKKLGPVPENTFSGGAAGVTSADQVASVLSHVSFNCSLHISDGQVSNDAELKLYATAGPAQSGLVRQGVVMNHIILTRLAWGGEWGGHAGILGGVEFWLELSQWGDRIAVELAWDNDAIELPVGTVASGTLVVGSAMASGQLGVDSGATLLLGETGLQITDEAGESEASAVAVTSAYGTVVQRAGLGDVFVMVPSAMSRCGYATGCAPLALVDLAVQNGDAAAERTVRLSVVRNFPTRGYAAAQGGNPGAEITGLSVVLFDEEGNPTGVPLQISKNWHTGSTAAYWAGYNGYWWTVNLMLRLPPGASFSGQLGFSYQEYGGVPAFSHAQLSIVGYSDQWQWEESALGSGGENLCLDPLGSHTRAAITDVRPNLFDAKWKENVGGGDWLVYFNGTGSFVYQRSLEHSISTAGPCLSNATYTAVTEDDAIATKIVVNGGRTDDMPRYHFHLRYDVLRNTTFSRLAFFQLGADYYSYHADFTQFIVGDSAGTIQQTIAQTCADSRRTYDPETLPFKQALAGGEAPWWVSMGPNTDSVVYDGTNMVVGDRGLVIREFSARLGGETVAVPSISALCQRLELAPPAGLGQLQAGDYWEAKLELVVLPRDGVEYAAALANTGSHTLQTLDGLATWERVRAQALGGALQVSTADGEVESHYPVRVCVGAGREEVLFHVAGPGAMGFVPVVVCGLESNPPVQAGLWYKADGAEWELLDQSVHSATDFYQTNYDPASGTFERVYNVELPEAGGYLVFFGQTPPSSTAAPSKMPTAAPTKAWGKMPTAAPSKMPTAAPSKMPTAVPSKMPTAGPSKMPTAAPSKMPTDAPSKMPTAAPSKMPTVAPSKMPTVAPSKMPTAVPSKMPTAVPSKMPTTAPEWPTKTPTAPPSEAPTAAPTPGFTPTETSGLFDDCWVKKIKQKGPTKVSAKITCDTPSHIVILYGEDDAYDLSSKSVSITENAKGKIVDNITLKNLQCGGTTYSAVMVDVTSDTKSEAFQFSSGLCVEQQQSSSKYGLRG